MAVLKYKDPATGAWIPTPAGMKGDPGASGPPGGVFVGAIIAFGGPSINIPGGYLGCLGQELSRATYAALFGQIGTTWGNGDGINTFNAPNGQGRMLVGAGGNFALGTVGGSADLIIPQHAHGVRSGAGTTDYANTGHLHGGGTGGQNQGHTHGLPLDAVFFQRYSSGTQTPAGATQPGPVNWRPGSDGASNDHAHAFTTNDQDRNHYHGMSVDSSGSNPVNGNLPPWAAVTYVIKF